MTSRGNRRQAIYHDDDDRRFFLTLQKRTFQRFGWCLREYCLMTNHFHLLFDTPRADLATGMHRLNSAYATHFNERHGFDGHLFDRRYGSRLVETEEHLLEVLRYIAFNPVKAGLCSHPREWRWSSFYAVDHSFVFDV